MLSILIPTYNYDITHLVYELHKQATEAEIDFADFITIALAVSAKLKEKNT